MITIIDSAIITNASGGATISGTIRSSLRQIFTRPHTFLFARPCRLIFALYFSTYLAANTVDTAMSTLRNNEPSRVSSGTSKFAATSVTNLTFCVYKDSQFARIFGSAPSSRPLPPISYALFALRDSMTVFASFNAPPLIAPLLPIGAGFESWISRATAAQFLAPAAMQLVSTPLHLAGLDLYNRPSGKGRTSALLTGWLR